MKAAELRPGWRTDLILHAHGGVLAERDDCLVVRTPANPSFYWGNCLLLPQAPADHELAHWEARFDAEILAASPTSSHRSFGINAPPAGEHLPAWLAAGYELIHTAVLRQGPGALRAPARRARGTVEFRPFDLEVELEQVVAQQVVDTEGFDPAGYEEHRRQQMQRYARMARLGQARWFGLWCDGTLAADCGLMRSAAAPGAVGRFQHVGTHPAWRRRGLCTALVHAVTRWGFEQWQLAETFMCADPDDVAIGIYEALGFVRIDAEWGLQKRAPRDVGVA
jgi:RimJ/RimL family protein N-acetyltransferase